MEGVSREEQTYEIGRSGVDLKRELLLGSAEIDVESVGAESRSDTAERPEIRSDVHVKRAAAGDIERNDPPLGPAHSFVSHHSPSLTLARPRHRHPSSGLPATISSVVSPAERSLVIWVRFGASNLVDDGKNVANTMAQQSWRQHITCRAWRQHFFPTSKGWFDR